MLLLHELRGAARRIGRRPATSLLVVSILALGIGSSAALFSILQAIFLRPIPFAEAHRLVRVQTVVGGERGRLSMREVENLRQETDLFAGVAAYVPGFAYTLNAGGTPEELPAICTTRNLFPLLGVDLLHGELWPESWDRSRNFGFVLSHRAFQRSFGGDPHLVGGSATLDGAPYTVFGVLPPGFDFPFRSDLYRSIFINDQFPDYEDRRRRVVVAVARLATGVDRETARSRLASIAARWRSDFADGYEGVRLTFTPLRESYVGEVRPYLGVLVAAVGLVLLIACFNAATLLLAEILGRRHEIALRTALGAGRWHIVGHVLAESVGLASVGAACGLALAAVLVRLLTAVVRFDLPSFMVVEIDAGVIAFAALAALASGLVAGLPPALRVTRAPALASQLRRNAEAPARPKSGGRRRVDRRALLVVAEIALSLVLLIAAGLMVRSLLTLLRADAGFTSEKVLSFRLALTWLTYSDDDRVRAFHSQLLERLAAMPGVVGVGLASNLPQAQTANRERGPVTAQGQSEHEASRNPLVDVQRISPGYLSTLQIPLHDGRDFGSQDGADSERVALVSRGLARRLWPRGEALGMRLRVLPPEGPWRRIVGIVGNVKHDALSAPAGHHVYLPAAQPRPPDSFHVVLRTGGGDAAAIIEQARRAVESVDAEQAVFDVLTMRRRMLETVWRPRVAGLLLALFAVVALILAATGIYGLLSSLTRQRRGELAIRIALGAGRGDVVRLVVVEALVWSASGAGAGMVAAALLVRFLAALLYDVAPLDPATFVAAPALMLLVAAAAALRPALRAAVEAPGAALRSA